MVHRLHRGAVGRWILGGSASPLDQPSPGRGRVGLVAAVSGARPSRLPIRCGDEHLTTSSVPSSASGAVERPALEVTPGVTLGGNAASPREVPPPAAQSNG